MQQSKTVVYSVQQEKGLKGKYYSGQHKWRNNKYISESEFSFLRWNSEVPQLT